MGIATRVTVFKVKNRLKRRVRHLPDSYLYVSVQLIDYSVAFISCRSLLLLHRNIYAMQMSTTDLSQEISANSVAFISCRSLLLLDRNLYAMQMSTDLSQVGVALFPSF